MTLLILIRHRVMCSCATPVTLRSKQSAGVYVCYSDLSCWYGGACRSNDQCCVSLQPACSVMTDWLLFQVIQLLGQVRPHHPHLPWHLPGGDPQSTAGDKGIPRARMRGCCDQHLQCTPCAFHSSRRRSISHTWQLPLQLPMQLLTGLQQPPWQVGSMTSHQMCSHSNATSLQSFCKRRSWDVVIYK